MREDGTVDCWGENNLGPITPPDGVFASVSMTSAHACGMREGGTVDCWGWPSSFDAARPPEGTFAALSAGVDHTCGLSRDGSIVCWGTNKFGQTTAPHVERNS